MGAAKVCRRFGGRGLLRVTAAQHLGEGLNLVLAAALLAGLLVVTLCAGAFDDVLALKLLFHAAQRTINRLILADLDFDGHGSGRVGERKSR